MSGFSAQHLMLATFARPELKDVRCLEKTITAPKVFLRDGIKGQQCWLGFRICLPRIQIDGADRVTLGPIGADEVFDPETAVNLNQEKQDEGTWLIPAPPLLPEDLQGRFLLRAFADTTLLCTRRVEFSTQVLDHDFSSPKDPLAWFSEGGRIDAGPLGPNAGPAEIAADSEPQPFIERRRSVWRASNSVPAAKGVETLKEILAAISLSRSKIAEWEILNWIRAALGIDGALLWDVLRAWVEAGFVDCHVFRRWRMKAYFARCPRLVAFRKQGAGTIHAVVQGLSTTALIRELERIAAREGAAIATKRASSPWLPTLFALDVPSVDCLERISAAASLLAPKWLLPIESCCSAVEVVRSQERQRLRNHVHIGTWNWDANRFDRGPQQPPGPVSLEWYRRHDAPDAYSVQCDPHPPWTTLSRTWAILVAECFKGTRPYRPKGETTLIRSARSASHLPLPVGRFAAIDSGVAPGPVDTANTWEYQYTFADAASRERVLAALWPPQITKVQLLRARWLATLMRSPEWDRKVTLPDSIRKILITRLPRPEAEPFVRTARVSSFLVAHLSALAKTLHALVE